MLQQQRQQLKEKKRKTEKMKREVIKIIFDNGTVIRDTVEKEKCVIIFGPKETVHHNL